LKKASRIARTTSSVPTPTPTPTKACHPLLELLGVLDRERVKPESLAQDLEVVLGGLIEVEPEEAAVCEQLLDRPTTEGHLAAALVVGDVTDRRSRPIERRRCLIVSLGFACCGRGRVLGHVPILTRRGRAIGER
jgi:hypothetical protein